MDFLSTDLRKFYASVALRHFGLSLISIFVPAFLYLELKFPLPQILFYFFLQESLTMVFCIITGRLISGKGARASVLLSVPFSILAYFFLPYSADPLFLFLSAASRAAYAALYFPAFHVFLGRSAEEGKAGHAIGKTWSVYSLVIVIAPAVGGMLLQFSGYNAVFALLVLLQLISVAMLPKMGKNEPLGDYATMAKKVSGKEKLSWFSQGLTIEAGDVLWPLYSFVILGTYAFLGALKFTAGILVAAFSLWIGGKTDDERRDKILRRAWLLGSITWAIRFISNSPIGVFLGNLLGDSAFMGTEAPIMHRLYSDGRRNNDLLTRVIVREMILRLSIIPMIALALLLPSLELAFLAFAIFFLVLAFFPKQEN